MSEAGDGWRFKRKILLPLVGAMLCAVILACFGIYWTTERSDAVSVERQIRTTRHAIDLSIDELAKEQETIAAWDDLVLELRKPQPDWQWVDDNVGLWLHGLFGHDQVYILGPDDRAIYAMVGGTRRSPADFGEVTADFAGMIDAVRGRASDKPGRHDRYPGVPPVPDATVQTTAKAIHDSHLTDVAGRPAAASVMRIVPLTDNLPSTEPREHLLVSVRFLDGGFLQDLSTKNLIASPRFSITGARRTGEESLPLLNERNKLIGYLLWRPELPGSAIMRVLAPITAMTVALMAIGMTLLAGWLWRSTNVLQVTLVELRASEAHAQHLAFHDPLTGLPNRALFNERLDQALAHARRGRDVAVLALDLDRFKQVNDTLGHHAGDTLIREFAVRLSGLARSNDTVARIGGDEFAVLLVDIDFPATQRACERVLDAVRAPFQLAGTNVFVGVSIGVVHAPQHGTDRIDLLRKADIALYRAKADGRECWRAFTDEMDETVRLRRRIEDELRGALESGKGLGLHYQPIVRGSDHRIVGLEALLRWEHPTRLIAPEQFVPVAEETGLICELGDWVLREACVMAGRHPDLFVAVNLSPVQFRSADFAQRVIDIVEQSATDPHRIELEVTEGMLLDDNDGIKEALRTLRAAGFRIALDDFGTGYSSLSYLRRFEVDKIKIDRSFIRHLGHAADSAAIVTAVVALGQAMGLAVTAEGVETPDQCSFLSAAGCEQLQGYLFSGALPADQLEEVLQRNESLRKVA